MHKVWFYNRIYTWLGSAILGKSCTSHARKPDKHSNDQFVTQNSELQFLLRNFQFFSIISNFKYLKKFFWYLRAKYFNLFVQFKEMSHFKWLSTVEIEIFRFLKQNTWLFDTNHSMISLSKIIQINVCTNRTIKWIFHFMIILA